MRVPRAVAKFNRRITNPLAVRFGGWAPLNGTLEQVGQDVSNTAEYLRDRRWVRRPYRLRTRISLGTKCIGRWPAVDS
jgi:hypothetical protein